ncbi:ubiquitin carboxyl-terminal hydrolase 5/13 [Enteropsectra breve]|nr:ubiquitin carboxyl-terminal hydrolase 5/13 [Enteropsectra breve]
MALNLSDFKNTCCYCFTDIKAGICFCTCGLSTCIEHREFHEDKFGCECQFIVFKDDNNNLEVTSCDNPEEIRNELCKAAENATKEQKKACPHQKEQIYLKDLKDTIPKCGECGMTDNLWICLDCGYVGCGRLQYGMKGNGHAEDHCNSTREEHAQVAYISSLGGSNEQVFCYKCKDFVSFDKRLSEVATDNSKEFQENIEAKENDPVLESDPSLFTGIRNEGQTCFISSVLQMLGTILSEKDLTVHFQLCENNPVYCICCQYVRIMNELRTNTKPISCISIPEFIETVFMDMDGFYPNVQGDASEFLSILVERLEFYEDAGLLPACTESFEYKTTNTIECSHCNEKSENTVKSKLLFVEVKETIAESIEELETSTEVKCECKKMKTMKNKISGSGKYLVVISKRYRFNEGAEEKVSDPIKMGEITVGGKKYLPKGAICHAGATTSMGHYTWCIKEGSSCYCISDSLIKECNEKEMENGTIFLFESV